MPKVREFKPGDAVFCVDSNATIRECTIVGSLDLGVTREVYNVEYKSGSRTCTKSTASGHICISRKAALRITAIICDALIAIYTYKLKNAESELESYVSEVPNA